MPDTTTPYVTSSEQPGSASTWSASIGRTLLLAVEHHEARNRANAALHAATQVRYSPLTFRLAEAWQAVHTGAPLFAPPRTASLDRVLRDLGAYPQDTGR